MPVSVWVVNLVVLAAVLEADLCLVTQLVIQNRLRAGSVGAALPLIWSGWPDLNRRLLRPELAAALGVWPSSQLAERAGARRGWRLCGDVAVLSCCAPSAR